jgi:ribosomal protein S18 acetylase RimI-like enzyme
MTRGGAAVVVVNEIRARGVRPSAINWLACIMEARQFSRRDFPDLLDLVARNAANRPVGHTYLMTSDVAWQFPDSAPKDNIRLWSQDGVLVAYAWFQPPDEIKFDVRTGSANYADLIGEILAWAQERRVAYPPSHPHYIEFRSMEDWAEAIRNPPPSPSPCPRYLVTSALETDGPRSDILRENGFAHTLHFEPVLTCDLTSMELPDAPDMFVVRQVEEAEFHARVALHSAAWAPAAGFNMDRYLKVRAITEVFDPELDIVAAADDGRFASYTIAWKDPISLIGSFEPFGTHPDFRGSGASEAVIAEGLRRMIGRGMRHARIYTAGFNHRAARLYQRCGFTQVDVNRTVIKKL